MKKNNSRKRGPKPSKPSGGGKGDGPRSCWSKRFKDNYDTIDWGEKKKSDKGNA
jgi:hypothetical protein